MPPWQSTILILIPVALFWASVFYLLAKQLWYYGSAPSVIYIVKKTLHAYPTYKSDGEHIGIIISDRAKSTNLVKTAWHFLRNQLIYTVRVDNLINYFRHRKIPYNLTLNPSEDDFCKIMCNKKVHSVFIIGHGRKDSFKLDPGHKCFLKYNRFKHAPPKKFVAQYHCNGGDRKIKDLFRRYYYRGESLREIMNARGFDESGLLFTEDINEHIKTIIGKSLFDEYSISDC